MFFVINLTNLTCRVLVKQTVTDVFSLTKFFIFVLTPYITCKWRIFFLPMFHQFCRVLENVIHIIVLRKSNMTANCGTLSLLTAVPKVLLQSLKYILCYFLSMYSQEFEWWWSWHTCYYPRNHWCHFVARNTRLVVMEINNINPRRLKLFFSVCLFVLFACLSICFCNTFSTGLFLFSFLTLIMSSRSS